LSRIPLIGPFLFGRVTKNETTNELFLFLTPHIISSDGDVDKLRDAVKEGSDLLKQIDVGPRIIPRADTLPPLIKPDTIKKPDSLTTLRRRPPEPR
jgi:type II secretory pathway component GspD/PulD (secretin)